MFNVKLNSFYYTLRYLKPVQIIWRIIYTFKNNINTFKKIKVLKKSPLLKEDFVLKSLLHKTTSFIRPYEFTFINQSHIFQNSIDWNFHSYGKLWTYNLNYFDFLLQKEMDEELGLKLISDYCHNIKFVKEGLEPYPTSLRCSNWIIYLSYYRIKDSNIDSILWSQLMHLSKNVEYHILGNHILENGFVLLFGSIYFGNDKLYKQAETLVSKQLREQVLRDGAHFELSPMYHQILLGRLLDLINIIKSGSRLGSGILPLLEENAEKMLGWIKEISFSSGSIPQLNDAAINISPNTPSLIKYAEEIGISPQTIKLGCSGYRKYKEANGIYECVVDIGKLGPDYQPGHAHADTFTFELHFNGQPVIIDTGTSTYEPGERRSLERSTKAHNTVELFNMNSSDVWATHRVGRRAKVLLEVDEKDHIRASHNGYKHRGTIHQRSFKFKQNSIRIIDSISGLRFQDQASAFIHFAPYITVKKEFNKLFLSNGCSIDFKGSMTVELIKYYHAPEFNKLVPSICAKIGFVEKLETAIEFIS